MNENDTIRTTGSFSNYDTFELVGPAIPPSQATNGSSLNTLGPYQIQREIGRGAMGTVYEAIHTQLQRTVAVKVLPPELARSPQRLERFQREMAAIGRLEHPNIVLATDAGDEDGLCYIAMQFIDGHDLATILEVNGIINPADACEIVRQAALGLQHIHEQGLVHRDIKPSNIVLSKQGEVKILDLGIAMLRDLGEGKTCMTAAGSLMGTPDYIAPEQIGECYGVDIRADIYSLGCTLYGLLSGKPPFTGPGYTTFAAKLVGHANHQPAPLAELNPKLTPSIIEIVEKMMSKDRDNRPALPSEVAEALVQFCEPADLVSLANDRHAKRIVPAENADKPNQNDESTWSVRSRTGTAAIVVTVFVCVVAAVLWATGETPSGERISGHDIAASGGTNHGIKEPANLEKLEFTNLSPNATQPSQPTTLAAPINEIAASNEAIANNTAQIAGTLDEIREQFAAALAQDGAKENPQSPADHYFNACIHSQRGEYLQARRSYLAYFSNELPVVDPHLQFIQILKLQEGINGARELYAELPGDKDVPARRLATAMLHPSEQRTEMLEQLIKDEPGFAPAWYQLSREFSIERKPLRTLAAQVREKELLDEFINLHDDGKLLKFFLDQSKAANMLSDAEMRLKPLAEAIGNAIANPVTFALTMPVDVLGEISEWHIGFAIAEGALDFQYRIGEQGDFISTGTNGVYIGGAEMTDPRTGKPMPKLNIELPGEQGDCTIYVKYVDADEKLRGPFQLKFERDLLRSKWQRSNLENSKREWLMFQEEELVFTLLFHNREQVKSLVYGLDEEVPTLPKSVPQEPYSLANHTEYKATIPPATKFATIQVTYADGTESEVIQIKRRN